MKTDVVVVAVDALPEHVGPAAGTEGKGALVEQYLVAQEDRGVLVLELLSLLQLELPSQQRPSLLPVLVAYSRGVLVDDYVGDE